MKDVVNDMYSNTPDLIGTTRNFEKIRANKSKIDSDPKHSGSDFFQFPQMSRQQVILDFNFRSNI